MHVHILGICGTFMGGIAALARAAGHRVTGSDRDVYPPMSTQLAALGIELIEGYGLEQLELKPDMIVIGNVMSRGMPVIEAVLAERARFGAVRLYLGARTPADRLFTAEMNALGGRADLEVAEIVDRAGPEWLGQVGIVTQLFDQAGWDGSRATAFVCGPERMMQATAVTLAERGVNPAAIWLTLERNMACGVGTCGHCQLGPFFVCRDGPVFSVAELGTAFGREGL